MFFNISRIRIRRCYTIYKALETRLVLVIRHQIILLMHVNVQCEKVKPHTPPQKRNFSSQTCDQVYGYHENTL